MDDIKAVIAEMRDRKVNHGKDTSPTLLAWADRLEAALNAQTYQRVGAVDRKAFGYYEREEKNTVEVFRSAGVLWRNKERHGEPIEVYVKISSGSSEATS